MHILIPDLGTERPAFAFRYLCALLVFRCLPYVLISITAHTVYIRLQFTYSSDIFIRFDYSLFLQNKNPMADRGESGPTKPVRAFLLFGGLRRQRRTGEQ